MGNKRVVAIVIFLLLCVNLMGVVGYMSIEGWSFADAFYMTVITLSTTGYQEVQPLSTAGRYFTVGLITFGMGIVAYSISVTMNEIVSMNLFGRGRKKMQKKIDRLKEHTIVIGYGRMGKVICKELQKAKNDFVVIEKSNNYVNDLEASGHLFIEGDATDDDVLKQARIEQAKVLVTMVDNDGDSLYIALAAKTLNSEIYVVARANDLSARNKILRAGADKVVLPIVMSGQKVAQSVLNPAVEDFLDITGVASDEDNRIQLADITVEESSTLIGKTLRTCGFKRDGMIVVGIRKPDKHFVFAPSADYAFQAGDTLITLSHQDMFNQVMEQYHLKF